MAIGLLSAIILFCFFFVHAFLLWIVLVAASLLLISKRRKSKRAPANHPTDNLFLQHYHPALYYQLNPPCKRY
jgi:hypothetical protein